MVVVVGEFPSKEGEAPLIVVRDCTQRSLFQEAAVPVERIDDCNQTTLQTVTVLVAPPLAPPLLSALGGGKVS